jgi:hypothetical protein
MTRTVIAFQKHFAAPSTIGHWLRMEGVATGNLLPHTLESITVQPHLLIPKPLTSYVAT